VCCKGQGIPGAGGQSKTIGIIRRLFLRIWGGQEPPPPPEEKIFCPRGQAEPQPMLPARSALTPGPQQRLLYYFFKSLNCYQKGIPIQFNYEEFGIERAACKSIFLWLDKLTTNGKTK